MLMPHPQILPIVVFFSTVMSMLYYLGLMQWIIRKVLGCKALHGLMQLVQVQSLNTFDSGIHTTPTSRYKDSPLPPSKSLDPKP